MMDSEELIEMRQVYRPFTKRELERTLTRNPKHHGSVDPDAPVRTAEFHTQLAMEDEKYLDQLMKSLFHLVRRGEMEKCFDLCRSCHEHWRAVSLMGALYYCDPRLTSSGAATVGEDRAPEGNKNRQVYMQICHQIANDAAFSVHERALYASLCGDLKNILPVCHTWDDFVWAHYCAWTTRKAESWLARFPRGKSDEYSRFDMSQVQSGDDATSESDLFDLAQQHPHASISEQASKPFRRIQASAIMRRLGELMVEFDQAVRGGDDEIDVRYVRFMAHLAMVFQQVRSNLPPSHDPMDDTDAGSNKHTDMLDGTLGYAMLGHYIDRLIEWDKREFVPLYVSKMPYDLQKKKMAQFLQKMSRDSAEGLVQVAGGMAAGASSKINSSMSNPLVGMSAVGGLDVDERREVLARAHSYGLDVKEIVKYAVRQVFAQYPSVITTSENDSTTSLLTDPEKILSSTHPVSESDMFQIDMLVWILLDTSELALECLKQCNALYRRFLLEGKVNAALMLRRTVLGVAPQLVESDFLTGLLGQYGRNSIGGEEGDVEAWVLEQAHIEGFLDSREQMDKWNQCFSPAPGLEVSRPLSSVSRAQSAMSNATTTTPRRDRTEIRQVTEKVVDQMWELLTPDHYTTWMQDRNERGDDEEEEVGTSSADPKIADEQDQTMDLDDNLSHQHRTLTHSTTAEPTAKKQRRFEMQKLRAIYVPIILGDLYCVLYETRQLIPANMDKLTQLTLLVASEERKIYRMLMPSSTLSPSSMVDGVGVVTAEDEGSGPLRRFLEWMTDAYIDQMQRDAKAKKQSVAM